MFIFDFKRQPSLSRDQYLSDFDILGPTDYLSDIENWFERAMFENFSYKINTE